MLKPYSSVVVFPGVGCLLLRRFQEVIRIRRDFPSGPVVENPRAVQETWVQSLDQEDPLEEARATHSSILAWRTPWTEEPGGLQSMGSQRVGHHWATEPAFRNQRGHKGAVPMMDSCPLRTGREIRRFSLSLSVWRWRGGGCLLTGKQL